MRLAVISLGGKSSLSILDKAKNHFKTAEHIDIRQLEVHADAKNLKVLYHGQTLQDYDCIYVRGSYRYLLLQRSLSAALFHNAYMPLHPASFTLCHNKFLTMIELQKNKVNLPTTYLAATTESAKKLIENVNYPIIIKIPEGTHGRGVMFADSIASAKSVLDALEVFKQPYIIQEFIDTDATDVRAIVAGDRVIAAMKRKATKDELRANIHMGGIGMAYELGYDAEQVAIKAARAVNAELCAVDMLEGNKISVIEVNLSPGLEGITKATKKDVAGRIAEFFHSRTKQFLEAKKEGDYSRMISDIDIKNLKEIVTNLDIKAGIIRLPEILTKAARFKKDEEVGITVEDGLIKIRRKSE